MIPRLPFFSYLWPVVLGVSLGCLLLWGYSHRSWQPQPSVLSPLAQSSVLGSSQPPLAKPLWGFLPYWNLTKIDRATIAVDQIVYFGLTLQADGTILKRQDNNLEPGYYSLSKDSTRDILRQFRADGMGFMMVFSIFDNDTLDSLIRNPQAQQQAVTTILSTIEAYQLEGVNLDFEYNTSNPIQPGSKELLTAFISTLYQQIKQSNRSVVVSMDLFANAFIQNRYYDVTALSQVTDYLVLMGYDFHRASSDQVGPVAPLQSQSGPSILQAIRAAYTHEVPSSKIILAMPLYGYEWRTTTTEYGSATYPASGVLASYSRIQAILDKHDLKPRWDHVSLTPWFSYQDQGTVKQVYFDNDASLRLKLDLIYQAHLGGGALWALGYEGQDAPIWEVVRAWKQTD